MRIRLLGYLVIGLCVLSLVLCVQTPDARRTTQDVLIIDFSKKAYQPYQQEYERMLYPTVRISTPTGTGSGVIFNHGDHAMPTWRGTEARSDIYILSAAHVVSDLSEVEVEVYQPDKTLCLRASVVITDTTKDLALLRALCGSAVHSAQLAPESYTPYIFTPVYTVGCSLGLTPRPSQGIITSVGCHPERSEGSHNNRDSSPVRDQNDSPQYWEVSSPILPGNSGGPVYALVPSDDDSHAASRGGNARTYEVIGIAVWVHTYNNQIVTTMAGIVPIQEIYHFLETLNTKPEIRNNLK